MSSVCNLQRIAVVTGMNRIETRFTSYFASLKTERRTFGAGCSPRSIMVGRSDIKVWWFVELVTARLAKRARQSPNCSVRSATMAKKKAAKAAKKAPAKKAAAKKK